MLRNVLVLTGGDTERFKELGRSDTQSPRSNLCYPFYGALQEAGVGVTVRSCGNVSQDRKRLGAPGWPSSQFDLLMALRDFGKYDAVVAWGSQGPWLAVLSAIVNHQNRKILAFSWANYSKSHKMLAGWVRQALYERGLRLCGAALFITTRQMNEAVHELKCDPRRVGHLLAGVDTQFFAPLPAYANAHVRPELRGLRTQKYVVVAGDQLRDEQQIIPMLEGFNIGLVRLTQNKDTEQFWKQWVRNHQANFPVVCIAHLDWSEVRFVYQHCLCLLNLVDSSWQPAGLTVMTEAMACGVPVIVNSGLTPEEMQLYLSREEALPFIQVEGFNPVHARAALETLVNSDGKVQELGHRARLYVEKHFDIEQTSGVIFQALNKMVEGERSRS